MAEKHLKFHTSVFFFLNKNVIWIALKPNKIIFLECHWSLVYYPDSYDDI